MSDAILKLLLIDRDTIYRTGLRVLIEEFADLAVVAEADSENVALQILEIGDRTIDLVVLALDAPSNQFEPIAALELGRQIKLLYPNLPILLVSTVREPTQLAMAKAIGIDGYCFKNLSVSELVAVIRQVAKKQFFWLTDSSTNINVFSAMKKNWRLSGLQQIEETLQEVNTQLQVPGLTVLEKAIFAGHRRELLASRWLVNWILKPRTTIISAGIYPKLVKSAKVDVEQSFLVSNQGLIQQSSPPSIFASVRDKLQFSLDNLTDVPLEVDVLKIAKRRELLEIVLAKIELVIKQLSTAKVQLEQLPKMRQVILIDLWQVATIEFFWQVFNYSRK